MKIVDNTREVHFTSLKDGDVCRDDSGNLVMKVDVKSDEHNAIDLETGEGMFVDGWVTPLRNITLTID